MENPYSRGQDYPPYRPPTSTNIQDLNVPYHNTTGENAPASLTPSVPPHRQSQAFDSYNPYPRTEDKSPLDYANPYNQTPYNDDLSRPTSYQRQPAYDTYGKPVYPEPEMGVNAPTPPPPKRRTLFSRLFNGNQKFAYFIYIVSIIQVGVFIGELIKNGIVQHTPIEIQPTFNPLIGPSPYVLINMGARFDPCMHAIPGITDITTNVWPCLNNTANPSTSGPLCPLSDICGFGGFPEGQAPDQWYRVIVPIFLHGGIIHILINMIVQFRIGVDMEKTIGSVRFVIVYFTSGIMGFILGANFAGNGVPSTGCSGSLFGIIALVILELCYDWKSYEHPKRTLLILLVQVVVCFVLGLLPGLDNFSHLGGFATGLLLGIAVLRAPPRIRARIADRSSNSYDLDAPYSSLTGRGASSGRKRGLAGYFRGRKGWWWIWNLLRLACLVFVVVFMILLFRNFYVNGGGHCSWCRYLSCLPVNGWCDLGNLQTTNGTTSSSSRMFMF